MRLKVYRGFYPDIKHYTNSWHTKIFKRNSKSWRKYNESPFTNKFFPSTRPHITFHKRRSTYYYSNTVHRQMNSEEHVIPICSSNNTSYMSHKGHGMETFPSSHKKKNWDSSRLLLLLDSNLHLHTQSKKLRVQSTKWKTGRTASSEWINHKKNTSCELSSMFSHSVESNLKRNIKSVTSALNNSQIIHFCDYELKIYANN